MTLTPNLSSSGYEPYNFGVAETYSYVPVANDQGRPLFAKATYLVNPNDINLVLSGADINIDLNSVVDQLSAIQTQLNQQMGQNGVVYADSTSGQVDGTFTTFQVVSSCQFLGLTATNSSLNGLLTQTLPQGFTFNAPVTRFSLAYGSVLAYKF